VSAVPSTDATGATGATGVAAGGGARIADRGYRRYTGARTGVWGAMRSVIRSTAQRALGIHRKFRFKVLPVLVIVMTYIPALVFVGITVLTNRFEQQVGSSGLDGGFGDGPGMARQFANQLISDFPDYYGFVVAAIALFAAFVAPEVLCTDRRTGMLGLYLASPLNRATYLVAKAMAVGMLLLTVTLGPPVLMLIGYATQGYGPSGLADWSSTVLRIVVTGVGIAAFHTTISMAISSITTRRAAASATFTLLVVGTGSVLQFLVRNDALGADWGVLNLLTLPRDFAYRVFGQEPDPFEMLGGDALMSTPAVYAGFAGWMVLGLLVIVDRYRRAEVTK